MTHDPTGTVEPTAARDGPASERPADPPGFELLEEIGRGGMGVVYRARDLTLNRHVAIKVLSSRAGPDGPASQRFLSEARITGQLQHPGIPAIHHVGSLPNALPFLAMKLVKGQTLDEILNARPNLAADRGRLLAVFEAVCQALGYAHAHGVIHRDVKPSNVMVGTFGEVQVMDWGLAKVLAREGSPPPVETADPEMTVAWTEVGDPPGDPREGSCTRAGSLLGTPAYAAPEQAAGEVDRVDTRSDVFGLGALLAVILTGKPPSVAATPEAVRVLAVRGNLGDCFARLAGCGAEPELVDLCQRCLAFEPADRPGDAGAVARAVAGLRAAAEERARQAELDRVRAEGDRKALELKAAEKRKRRRVLVALAAAVALLLAGGGGFLWWQDRLAHQHQAERALKAQQVRDGAVPLLDLAANLRNQAQYPEAAATLDRAAQLLSSGEADDLLPRIAQARADLDFVRALDVIFSNSYKARQTNEIRWLVDRSLTPKQYRHAFRRRGFDFAADQVDDLVRRLKESDVRPQLIEALDFWAVHEPKERLAAKLLTVLRKTEPGPWLDRMRDPAVRRDRTKLLALIREADPRRTPAARISILFFLGEEHRVLALSKLLETHLYDPKNFRINYALGAAYYALDENPRAEGFFRAAVAVRPANPAAWHGLGITIMRSGNAVRAVPVLRQAVALDPSAPNARNSLAWALRGTGELEESMRVLREGIQRAPRAPALIRHLGWIHCLIRKDYATGLPLLRKAVELAADDAQNHEELGWCLLENGKPQEALPHLSKAVELSRDWPHARELLARALRETGDERGAREQRRIAATLGGPRATVVARADQAMHRGDYDSAITAYKEVIDVEPNNAIACNNLAVCYLLRGKAFVATPAERAAVKQADVTEAITWLQKAVRIASTYAYAHANLGWCLFLKGRFEDAVTELELAHKLDPKTPWIKDRLEFLKKEAAAHAASKKP
jgi:serine/threonine protein kinase/tetratricopeptide (TPR) repeat protein